MANPTYSSPKGIKDILFPESRTRRMVLDIFAKEASLSGYGEIVLPLFEEIGVFARVGESTEIVQKQMYDFHDKDDRHMVLRPESTASVLRAFIQHRPTTPWKCWYEGAHFRYEKPQAGRFRQFHQVGVEILGTDDPLADTEVIALGWRFFNKVGVQVKLLINSLGDLTSREKYTAELEKYLRANISGLSSNAKATLELNPLRVLDSKMKEDIQIISKAPEMKDFLSAADKKHFQAVCENLEALQIPYELEPKLVRGLDYYTKTAFEYIALDLDFAQDALGGGGRYDNLSETLGGPKCAGVGFALGIDRTLLAIKQKSENAEVTNQNTELDVFVVDIVGTQALFITDELRKAGVATDFSYDGRSLKAQMKLADRSGAKFAIIIGEEEIDQDSVSLVELRKSKDGPGKKSNQQLIPRSELLTQINELLKNNGL